MDEKINVIFLIVDALRAENLSCYGYPKLTSPNIDSLAKNGILLENAYSCIDQTDPSFTTIFSGKYPISHGIIHHGGGIEREEIQEFYLTGTKLLPEILKSKGHYIAAVDWLGRWHKKGYDFYGDSEGEQKHTKKHSISFRKQAGRYVDKLPYPIQSTIKRAGKLMSFSQPSKQEARSYTSLAINLLKQSQRKNFFLLIHFWDVHTPFDTIPDSYTNKFYERKSNESVKEMLKEIEYPVWRDKVEQYHLKGVKYIDEITAKYNSAINFIDHEIGRLINFLKEEGIFDQTLIVLTGDHGDNHMREGTFVGHFGLYERVIHVPLILAGGGVPHNRRVRGFVQHIDIVPTILDMLGMDLNSFYFDGKSLLPLIYGKEKQLRSEVYAMEGARRRFAIRTDNYKYIYSPSAEDLYHKLWKKKGIPFRPVYNNVVELYDLKKDPEERKNIFAEKPEVAKEMRDQLLKWIKKLEAKKEKVIVKNKIKRLKNLGNI